MLEFIAKIVKTNNQTKPGGMEKDSMLVLQGIIFREYLDFIKQFFFAAFRRILGSREITAFFFELRGRHESAVEQAAMIQITVRFNTRVIRKYEHTFVLRRINGIEAFFVLLEHFIRSVFGIPNHGCTI